MTPDPDGAVDYARPLAVDLYAGLGGWTHGLLAEGWDVIGFDIERHRYPKARLPESNVKVGVSWSKSGPGNPGKSFNGTAAMAMEVEHGEWSEYPAQLVLQDVLTLHGKQFKDVDLIVASPPCQFFSYTAMPWSRAKQLAAEVRADPVRLEKELALFKACFRIQREACEAAGRHIPMVVENVRGAEPWVGRAAAKYGSFFLWGDVPALIPVTNKCKVGISWSKSGPGNPGKSFDGTAAAQMGRKVGKDWFGGYGGGFGWDCSPMRRNSSKSSARKAASAMIAKIPEPLSRWIGSVYHP